MLISLLLRQETITYPTDKQIKMSHVIIHHSVVYYETHPIINEVNLFHENINIQINVNKHSYRSHKFTCTHVNMCHKVQGCS